MLDEYSVADEKIKKLGYTKAIKKQTITYSFDKNSNKCFWINLNAKKLHIISKDEITHEEIDAFNLKMKELFPNEGEN